MIYVTSDIHGNLSRWESIKRQINLNSDDHLYVLGDVIDYHSDGLMILCDIMHAPNITMLMGDHEYMMQQHYSYDRPHFYDRIWYPRGGYVTDRAFKCCKNDEKNDILDFISSLSINVDLDVNGNKYLLSHAAPLLKQQPCEYDSPEEYAVRHCTLPDERLGLDRMLIHGHTPVLLFDDAFPPRIRKSRDKININCGAGYVSDIGRLACLRLDDMTEYYSD